MAPIIFNTIGFGSMIGGSIIGIKGMRLAWEVRESNFGIAKWNGNVSIRGLRKLLPLLEDEREKEKIIKAIYYIRLSRIISFGGFGLIVLILMFEGIVR